VRRVLGRLRWQLTLSHLIAIAVTLVSMIAAVVAIASAWLSFQNDPARRPAQTARQVAQSASGLIRAGPSSDLDAVLRAFVAGTLSLDQAWGPPQQQAWGPPQQPGTVRLEYVVVLGADGQVLGASEATSSVDEAERQAWQSLANRATRNIHTDAMASGTADGRAALLGAAPVLDDRGRPFAAVVVGMPGAAVSGPAGFPLAALAVFGVATIVVLVGSSVFALASSSLVAYLLSRRLVRRIERLGRAAESLRAGNLGARLPESDTDEVGQLQRSFNVMAADLQHSLNELAAERDRVTGLLESRRQLVAGVSHELRTPVATVRGYLESALGRDSDLSNGTLRADLETMERETQRLQHLIEDLFTLSRAEVGRLELRVEPTDVGSVVQRMIDTQAPLAWQQHRVELVAKIEPALACASADARRLEQIVSNLLSNAIRHTPPGGLVAATVADCDADVRVEICDTGDGISPDELPHIFERFYRGSQSEQRPGVGLGLALVRELTEAMGGSIHVTSTPGEGSCFTLHLPKA